MATTSTKKNAVRSMKGLETLLYQNLETELGGVQIYTNAIRLAVDEELREEWEKYLTETKRHVDVARQLLTTAGLDPDAEVAVRLPIRLIGETLVAAMGKAAAGGDPELAQITAAQCLTLAETADHSNWQMIGLVAKELDGDLGEALRAAHEEIEVQEDHHVYHTTGWARELRARSLGLPAQLPPPEEEQDVESAMEAAQAKQGREPEAEKH